MKSVVTGAAGFIRANLVRRLVELGRDVICVENIPRIISECKPSRVSRG